MTTIAKALKQWSAENDGKSPSEATDINLCAKSIAKLDSKTLATLKCCEKLSLSTNMIDKMINLPGMTELKILSLGRNNLKKIEKLEDVAGTLEQLWLRRVYILLAFLLTLFESSIALLRSHTSFLSSR